MFGRKNQKKGVKVVKPSDFPPQKGFDSADSQSGQTEKSSQSFESNQPNQRQKKEN